MRSRFQPRPCLTNPAGGTNVMVVGTDHKHTRRKWKLEFAMQTWFKSPKV